MRNKIFSALVVIAFGFTGCGGGGGGSTGTDTPTTQTGTFIDAPVEGLEYSTPTLSGFTNANGEFQYKTGETVTFKIGNLELGSATGGTTITPLTLAGDTDLNNIGTKATNIARILQTLDNNSSNGAKLVIPTSIRDLNVSSSNFESDAVLNEILTKAQVKTSVAYTLKNSTLAKNEMIREINTHNTLNSYEDLKNGFYTGANEQSKYYHLRMKEGGRLLYSKLSRTDLYIYDKNFNLIKNWDQPIGYLNAGDYIVKIKFGGYYTYDNGYITFYSDKLSDGEIPLNILANKSYPVKAAETSIYKLNVLAAGNVSFDFNGWTEVYIYNNQLENITKVYSNWDYHLQKGTYAMEAGEYYVTVKNDNTSGTLKILSNVLEQ